MILISTGPNLSINDSKQKQNLQFKAEVSSMLLLQQTAVYLLLMELG